MFNWFKKFFNKFKLEHGINYHVIISKKDADELEYYWESLYSATKKNEMEFRKKLFPSMVKKGLIFYSDSGISFIITKIMADGNTFYAKRYSDES